MPARHAAGKLPPPPAPSVTQSSSGGTDGQPRAAAAKDLQRLLAQTAPRNRFHGVSDRDEYTSNLSLAGQPRAATPVLALVARAISATGTSENHPSEGGRQRANTIFHRAEGVDGRL